MITSTSNPQVKNLQQLKKKVSARNEQDAFLVEGIKMFQEAPGERIQKLYVSKSLYDEKGAAFFGNSELEVLDDRVYASVSDTKTPQGVLCVMKQYHYSLDDLAGKKHPFLMILENLQDPGNLGTMIRTGEGAGITGVIMNNQTVDIFNPKTIRATMGSIFRVPFVYVPDLAPVLEQMHAKGIYTYAAHLKGQEYYDSFSFREPTAFLIGNEGNGLSKEISDQAGQYLKIPMEGRVESLNASIAAALLMYEAHRQRSKTVTIPDPFAL